MMWAPMSERTDFRRLRGVLPVDLGERPTPIKLAGRRFDALRAATSAVANIVRERGASERPACSALYSSAICRKIGSAIMAPPSVICWSICWVTPTLNFGNLKSSGSRTLTFPCRCRLTSQKARAVRAIAPAPMSAPTNSPPSCQTRMPSTIPPMPRTDKPAPTTSRRRGPV